MSQEQMLNELSGISENKIKIVFLQVAYAIDAEGLPELGLSHSERRSLESYAYDQLTEQNLIHRVDAWEVFRTQSCHRYALLAVGFKESREALEVLYDHGYDPFNFFSCTPDDENVLPNCRYAQLVYLPGPSLIGPISLADTEQLIERWGEGEIDYERDLLVVRRHQCNGELKKEVVEGLIHTDDIGGHVSERDKLARPMLVFASLVVHDLVRAITNDEPENIPEANLAKTRESKRRGRPPITHLTPIEKRVMDLHAQGMKPIEINRTLIVELKEAGEESAQKIIQRISRRKKRAAARERRKDSDTNQS